MSPAANGMFFAMQMYGPGVAPFSVGKQNLVLYVLRQLEKHFFIVNQYFQLDNCSHNTEQQTASSSLTIVTYTQTADVGLDTVRYILLLQAACQAGAWTHVSPLDYLNLTDAVSVKGDLTAPNASAGGAVLL